MGDQTPPHHRRHDPTQGESRTGIPICEFYHPRVAPRQNYSGQSANWGMETGPARDTRAGASDWGARRDCRGGVTVSEPPLLARTAEIAVDLACLVAPSRWRLIVTGRAHRPGQGRPFVFDERIATQVGRGATRGGQHEAEHRPAYNSPQPLGAKLSVEITEHCHAHGIRFHEIRGVGVWQNPRSASRPILCHFVRFLPICSPPRQNGLLPGAATSLKCYG